MKKTKPRSWWVYIDSSYNGLLVFETRAEAMRYKKDYAPEENIEIVRVVEKPRGT